MCLPDQFNFTTWNGLSNECVLSRVQGKGDTSGGCRCMINGKRCHTDCKYCHWTKSDEHLISSCKHCAINPLIRTCRTHTLVQETECLYSWLLRRRRTECYTNVSDWSNWRCLVWFILFLIYDDFTKCWLILWVQTKRQNKMLSSIMFYYLLLL